MISLDFAVFLSFLIAPLNTEASVFSFSNSLFAAENADNSKQNSQNIALLQAVPNVDPNPTKGGPDMSIVDKSALESSVGPSGTANEIQEKAGSDQISVYTVRSGDTLQGIAQMFDVSVNTILWANDLKSSKDLRKDDQLVILPISGVEYVVKNGDTILSIAKRFNGDVTEILNFNDLPPNPTLKAGDKIIIPDGEIAAPSKTLSSKKASSANSKSTTSFIRPISGGKKTQGLHGACGCGVDLGTKIGAPVYASEEGSVIIARTGGWYGGYGNHIVISHANGVQTLYAHLSKVFVKVGEKVTKGEQIGAVGMSGNTSGPHLHFEYRGRGAYNPF